jgi:hypothetical protein
MRNFKSELKIWFSATVVAATLMFSVKGAQAAPTSIELCNWGKWAYTQNIQLKDLVDALNSIEAMPYEDKLIVVRCFVESMESM